MLWWHLLHRSSRLPSTLFPTWWARWSSCAGTTADVTTMRMMLPTMQTMPLMMRMMPLMMPMTMLMMPLTMRMMPPTTPTTQLMMSLMTSVSGLFVSLRAPECAETVLEFLLRWLMMPYKDWGTFNFTTCFPLI